MGTGMQTAARVERERSVQLDKNDEPTSKNRTEEVSMPGRLI